MNHHILLSVWKEMCLVNDNFGIKNYFLSVPKMVLQVEVHCSYACVAFEMVSKVSMNIYF